MDLLRQIADRRLRRWFDRKVQTRRKANGAQHPQMVLFETALRPADRADHAGIQIGSPADQVDYLVGLRIQQQSVNREIAP